ncbi:MAG: hypothetical protein Q7R43_00350 [Candidatus Daviesbacteria bacterium]|nr:hypothetical protein [Candidatus Daviesbacteria bacterium]
MSQLFKTKWQKSIWIIWVLVVIWITGNGQVELSNPILIGVQALTSLVIALVVTSLFVKQKDV